MPPSSGGCRCRNRPDRAGGRQGSNAASFGCRTRQHNAHRTEQREVLYPWHSWAGRTVYIHEVIEKVSGHAVRCSLEGDAMAPRLELPDWMLDRAACFGMEIG